MAEGTIVIPANVLHKRKKYCGVGAGLKTKVNANIGTSKGHSGIAEEKRKLGITLEFGADAVMDLSTGPDINLVRRELINNCPLLLAPFLFTRPL